MNYTVLILIIVALVALFPVIEHAATSPATLTQLATSSTSPGAMYGVSPWWTPIQGGGCGSGVCGGQGRPAWQYNNTRPVMQRGMYFGNPQFRRV